MRDPRSDFADCSPNTHEIASEMFDLPQPFGPTIAVMPSPGNFSSIAKGLEAQDLELFEFQQLPTPCVLALAHHGSGR